MKKEIFKVKQTNPKIYANFLITLSPHNNFKTSAEAWQNHSNRKKILNTVNLFQIFFGILNMRKKNKNDILNLNLNSYYP